MAEVAIPAGFSIAWLVLSLVGWYGSWRKGLELIHQDLLAHRTISRDIRTYLDTLQSQKDKVEAWRKLWCIPEPEPEAPEPETRGTNAKRKKRKGLPIFETTLKGPPDEFFLLLWGEANYEIIKDRLETIKSLFEGREHNLKRYIGRTEDDWKQMSKTRRAYLKKRFVYWDKVIYSSPDTVEGFASALKRIEEVAKKGWKEQSRKIIRSLEASDHEIGRLRNLHPYHVLMAHCLAKIAVGHDGSSDAEQLRRCGQEDRIRQSLAIVIDADIFKLAASPSDGDDLKNALEYVADLDNIRWKVDLLLRESNQPNEQFVRVEFERYAGTEPPPASRISDAFNMVVLPHNDKAYFRADVPSPRYFELTKVRHEESGPRLQSTIQDRLATVVNQGPPLATDLNSTPPISATRLLPEVPTYRAAFELAQATLLFLGTGWVGDLCRCAVRTGTGVGPTSQIGLDITFRIHAAQTGQAAAPQPGVVPTSTAVACQNSWCSTNYDWDSMNKPPRRLGLWLIELALGTVIVPSQLSNPNNQTRGAQKVERISVLVTRTPAQAPQAATYAWEDFTLDRVLSIAKRLSFNDNDDFKHAVEYCLTEEFPQSPNDSERELHLKKFYFRVVKP